MFNRYIDMMERQQKEFNEFPMFFAFDRAQFQDGLKRLGLEDAKDVHSIGCGGYVAQDKAIDYYAMLLRHRQELRQAIADDKDGTGFAYEMFRYELANHEYRITYCEDDAIEACGLTYEEVEKSPALKNALKTAKDDVLALAYVNIC